MKQTLFLILILLLSACAAQPPKTPAPPPALNETWNSIEMNQSGGIMGLSRSIRISASGEYSVTDDRAEKTSNGKLSSAQLKILNQEISSLTEFSTPQIDMTCADCFVYTITIQRARPMVIQLNDITLNQSEFAPLVSMLGDLLTQASQ